MKKTIFLSALALLFFVGCRRDAKLTPASDKAKSAEIAAAKKQLIEFIHKNNLPARFNMPAPSTGNLNSVQSRGASKSKLNLSGNEDYSFNQYLVKSGINSSDYECSPTEIDAYVNNSVAGWNDDDFLLFNYFGNVAFDAAYVYDNTDGGQYYGSSGQFTNPVNRTFKDLLRFWDIQNDILLRDAHGNVYKNTTVVTNVLILYGYPDADAAAIADLLKTVFGSSDFFYYNHPLLTFNAFSAPADPYFNTPKKVVMGDGIMQAYKDLGYGDVAPQAILAHEYGHQVQFANNVDFGNSPEGTRRTELMADAFSAYYLTNKRGAALNWKRVKEFLTVFFDIGDCQFDNPGHHGTPNQRMKAAMFGYQLATDAQKQGKIIASADFIALFDAALPNIVAPDAI